jgi:hypothetical protein
MAPEQILGRAVDCRTDVYALGITLYELLSGYRPFNARGKAEYLVLNAHVNDVPEPPTVYRFGIPQPIVDAVMRSLAKQPEARFQSVEDFMCALPDVTAPHEAAPQAVPTGTVAPEPKAAAPRVSPSGTVVLEGRPTPPRTDSSGTLMLDHPVPTNGDLVATRRPSGTMAFEYAPSKRLDPHDSMEFDYSAGTVWQQLHTPDSARSTAPTAPAALTAKSASAGTSVATRRNDKSIATARGVHGAPPDPKRLVQAYRPAVAALIVATLVLGTWLHYAQRSHPRLSDTSPVSSGPRSANAQASTEAITPPSAEPATPPPAVPSAGVEPAVPLADVTATSEPLPAAPGTAMNLATTTSLARHDLSGTWRGEYVDASGKQLLRVVSLNIRRVHDDGGIEGTLHYEGPSGNGECKLHPRGSTYTAGGQRLQLSPEGCTPHYPRELGVPLDFVGVNPQANTLRDGRIEAPTGEVIRVRLRRVTGV